MFINGTEYCKLQLSKMIDYAILNSDVTENDIKDICKLAKTYNFRGVHPNPIWVPLVLRELEGTDIETGLVVSFPFGANPTSFKKNEAKELVKILNGRPGCIDVVTNIGALKDKNYKLYTEDIAEIVKIGHNSSLEVKAIIETAMLTKEEIEAACECAVAAGIDFVKTSTGRGGIPQVKDIITMRKVLPPHIGIKYSGFGNNNPTELFVMALAAGATRFGTTIAPQIIDEVFANYSNIVMNLN
ncbi:MAG: deoxyribose-phosphate aldolase [Bacillota bacterium]